MPRPARLEKMFVRPKPPWSPFPHRPLPFRIVEWQTKKYPKDARVVKAKPPCQIPPIAPIKDWKIFRNDLVEVRVGKDTGKQGKVRAVARKKNQLKVVGLNCSNQYIEDMGDGTTGFLLFEEPLHYSEVKLVNPHTGCPTEVEWHDDEEGNRVRVCKESGIVIPKPPFERLDFKNRAEAKEGESDTLSDAVQQYTYVPSLLFFHEEIMKEMNIPMSVEKTELERRDLIMKEIEEDLKAENYLENSDIIVENKSFFQKVKEKIFFW